MRKSSKIISSHKRQYDYIELVGKRFIWNMLSMISFVITCKEKQSLDKCTWNYTVNLEVATGVPLSTEIHSINTESILCFTLKKYFLAWERKKARELEVKENWIYSICIYKSTIFFIYLFSLIFHTRNTMHKNSIVYRKTTNSLRQSLIKYYHWSITYFIDNIIRILMFTWE